MAYYQDYKPRQMYRPAKTARTEAYDRANYERSERVYEATKPATAEQLAEQDRLIALIEAKRAAGEL